jgi:hypothetical protein
MSILFIFWHRKFVLAVTRDDPSGCTSVWWHGGFAINEKLMYVIIFAATQLVNCVSLTAHMGLMETVDAPQISRF